MESALTDDNLNHQTRGRQKKKLSRDERTEKSAIKMDNNIPDKIKDKPADIPKRMKISKEDSESDSTDSDSESSSSDSSREKKKRKKKGKEKSGKAVQISPGDFQKRKIHGRSFPKVWCGPEHNRAECRAF
ncbi:unnamed protein product [Leuciscus chuanchicus]